MSNEEKIQEIAATMRSEKLVRSRVFPFFSKEKLPYRFFQVVRQPLIEVLERTSHATGPFDLNIFLKLASQIFGCCRVRSCFLQIKKILRI